MWRWLQLVITAAIFVESGFICAQAKSTLPAENSWNPQHIDSLPVEVRSAIAPFARACGGRLAAEHSFASYFQRGTAKLIGLHFEHLHCPNRAAVCRPVGCLHQVYMATDGKYRLLSSSYVPELDLTQVKVEPGR